MGLSRLDVQAQAHEKYQPTGPKAGSCFVVLGGISRMGAV